MATPLLAANHGPAGILSSAVHIACACCAGRTRVCIIHPVWLSALCVRTTHLVVTLLVASFFHATGSACCPRGHALELFTAATNGCNACSKSIPRGSHMQRCHMCDYDVCQSCQPLVLQGACAQSTRVCTLVGCDTSRHVTHEHATSHHAPVPRHRKLQHGDAGAGTAGGSGGADDEHSNRRPSRRGPHRSTAI
jgi:hypothetical protein